jgi:hypothetical protein
MASRIVTLIIAVVLLPTFASAHCDTLNGPVVSDAKHAIATNDVTPVLKWLRQADETEVRRLFEQTIKVRGLNSEAQQLADRFFFETVVRLHRAGEGAAYTGLLNEDPEPVIRLTDEALSNGSADKLLNALQRHMQSELTKRFEAARAAKNQSGVSVKAGREYVATYVELTHFVERLHDSILASEAHAHSRE